MVERGVAKQGMPEQRLILALDTAGDAIALAVGELVLTADGRQPTVKLLASGDLLARREANVQLVPAIDRLFGEHGLDKAAVSCVVCGRGPGSFTGVRIAVATAKGLAAGLDVSLYGVATPDALAWQAWLDGVRGSIAVLLDAMRGEVYPARYILGDEGARREDPLTVIKAKTLAEDWQAYEGELVLTGDALEKHGELFSRHAWLDRQLWHPRGEGLLKAFEALLYHGEVKPDAAIHESIASLLPVYTRLSDAEENERKRLASGGVIAQGALTAVPASGVNWPRRSGQNVYRPAAKSDIPSMVALEQSAYAHAVSALDGECWTEAMYQKDIGNPGMSWWVCYQDEELAGFIGGQLLDGQMHVLDVVVGALYRRQGIAQHLLTRLAWDAKDLGATELTLEVRSSNAAAQALYTERGLSEVGRRKQYYAPTHVGEPREDALIMTGTLEAVLAHTGDTGVGSAYHPGDEVDDTGAGAAYRQNPQAAPSASPLILAIESSCDETAVALIDGQGRLLKNVVASQVDFHARFGGVVPEIASRKHTEAIYPTVMEAMEGLSWRNINAIAVTYAPGLIGALVVGMAFAKGLCWATDLPLIKVNHLEGHIYANRFVLQNDGEPRYQIDSAFLHPPFIIALLSGGNTLLVHVRDWGSYQVLGETLDDAVGEAYDKVAKALGLGYPGGPVIARLAQEGNPKAIDFPRALLHSHGYQFSLSGLKTAVLTVIRLQAEAGELNVPDIAASFEQAVIDVQVAKALRACKALEVHTFCIGGGVAANKALREAYRIAMEPQGIRVIFPPQLACTDNAAMIAAVALTRYEQGKFASLSDDAAAHENIEEEY